MSKLLQRLSDASRSGVYRTHGDEVVLEVVRGGGLCALDVSLLGVKSDLSWQRADGWVILLREFAGVQGDDLGVLVDVLASAAEFWAGRGKLFFAVFIDPSRSLGLPDLYREK
jgi:hypothetical protein